MIVRQGDLLLRHTTPGVARSILWDRAAKQVTLAYGEVSGHAHVLTSEEEVRYVEPEGEGVTYVSLAQEGVITHEEHEAVTLVSGVWEVIRQHEYVPDIMPKEPKEREYGRARQVVD